MTTLTSTQIDSMNRNQVWAYITDNSLPVAKKRSTVDARQALSEYMESLVEDVYVSMETISHAVDDIKEQAVEQQAVENVVSIDIEATSHTVDVCEEHDTHDKRIPTGASAATTVVAVIVMIQVIFIQVLIPTLIQVVNLATYIYLQLKSLYTKHLKNHADSQSISYFQELVEIKVG